MGCGRVDLIDLFDLARDNLPPVRQRELQAHLQACPSCSEDFGRLSSIGDAFSRIREQTAVSLSASDSSKLEVKLMEVVSSFQPAKAKRLWRPQTDTAERRRIRRRSWAGKLLIVLSIVVLVMLLTGGSWVAYSVYAGSGYPEEPLWRIALLLPEPHGRSMLELLPVRDSGDILKEILDQPEQTDPPPIARRLAGLSSQGKAEFIDALTGPFGDEWYSVLAAARLLLPYAGDSGNWEKAALILSGIRKRDPSVAQHIAGLQDPLRYKLTQLVEPWLGTPTSPKTPGPSPATEAGDTAASTGSEASEPAVPSTAHGPDSSDTSTTPGPDSSDASGAPAASDDSDIQ